MEAEVLKSGDTLRIELVNNLQNRSVLEDTDLGPVPGRSVRVKIVGTSRGSRLTLNSVLRKRPFVDYSALSSRNMSVELAPSPRDESAWRLRSKDPYVNQVRSNAELLGPSAIDRDLVFKGPPRGGSAKATEDIILDGTSVTSDPDFQVQSERTSGGRFQVGSPTIDVPNLEREDLRFPETRLNIPPGKLSLKLVEDHKWTSRNFEVDTTYPPDGVPDTTVTRWRLERVQHTAILHGGDLWVSETNSVIEDSGALNSASDGFPAPTSSQGFQDVPSQPTEFNDFPVLYGNEPEHRIRANLLTGDLAMTAGTTFQVDGQLEITHDEFAPQPNLLFGFDMDDEGASEFAAGLVGGSAIEDPEANSAALVASQDLQIDGIATGFGSLFADRSVTLRAKSGLRAEPDMAVAVHGESIRLTAEDPPEGNNADVHLQTDWEMFREAMNDNDYSGFDGWYDLESGTRRRLVGNNPDLDTGVRSRSVGSNARDIWDALSSELNLGSPPNFSAPPFGSEWSGNLSLDKYVRLREYARTGSRSWLNLTSGTRFQNVVSLVDNQIFTYSRWASIMGLPLADFMAADQPEVADVFFVGLVHAGAGGIAVDTNGSSFLVEGAVVSKGDLTIENAPSVDFVYNRLYLDDVVREFRGDPIELDQVYFKLN